MPLPASQSTSNPARIRAVFPTAAPLLQPDTPNGGKNRFYGILERSAVALVNESAPRAAR